MTFKKGERPTGRQKGTPNKATVEVKAILEKVHEGLGGYDAMLEWAKSSDQTKSKFYDMWVKLLPKDIHLSGTVAQLTYEEWLAEQHALWQQEGIE